MKVYLINHKFPCKGIIAI